MKKIFTLLMLMVFVAIESNSQTVVINTGTAGTPISSVGPIMLTNTGSFKASRYSYLYTQAELAAAGINPSDLITDLGWMKSNANPTTDAGKFRIYLKNSSVASYSSSTETWANLNAGTTLVYENLNQLIPATANPNYINFPLTSPFIYTGGSLEVSVEWDITAIAGNIASGELLWMWSTVPDRIYGASNTTLGALTTLSSTTSNTTITDRRPFIQITYAPSAPCAGVPVGGTANGSTALACPSTDVFLTVSGASLGSGINYQWQSSVNGLIWNDIVGATTSAYTQSMTTPLNFRRRMICNAGPDTAYSSTFFVDISSFLNCYCTSNATGTTNSSIRNVTISNINNTSPTACSQYTDYTSIQGVLNIGVTYPISVLTEDCEGVTFGTQRVAVFVDWNHNGLFTDAGELVYDPGTLTGAANVQFAGSINVPPTALTGITRMRVINVQATGVINPCGTYTSGETEDYFVDVQPAPANEAGVLAITQPTVTSCGLGQQLWVTLQNLGTSDLTSATFTLNINGLNIPVNNPWTGNVPAQSTAEIQVPVTYTFADGDSITISVSLPNGQTENPVFAFNNTTARRVYAGLSGNKTVYGAGADFPNLGAAIQAINFRGVCDTVYFKIASGVYNSQYILGEYPGSGLGKLVVFESATGNQADVEFNFAATAATDNYVFRFDGGDGYMIRNLTAKSLGTSFARVIDIVAGSNGNIIEGNMLIGDTLGAYSTTDVTRVTVASTNTSIDNGTIIRNNHIIGGSRSIHLAGMTTDFETGNVIEGNTIEKYAYAGIYLTDIFGYNVIGNTLSPRNIVGSDANSMYVLGTVGGGDISKNNIQSNRPGSSIYLSDVKGGAMPVMVRNNFLYQTEATTTELTRAIYILSINSTGITVANNSISVQSNNPATGAIHVADGSQIRLFNNNIGAFGAAPALKLLKSYSVVESDNNNIFATSISEYLGSQYATLAAHQSATNMEVNSVSVNPGFNANDLHTCAVGLNAAGMVLSYVSDDYDGDLRTSIPDIGADEFLGDAIGLLVTDNFLKCPAEQVAIGNTSMNGVTYSWSPSGNTSEITTTTAGTYIITATSSCGSFSDTATVVNKPLPDASFAATSVGLTGVFTNTSTNGTSYSWDFGDGNSSTDMSPTHVFENEGTYSVTLTVTNECGTDVFGPTPINVINAGVGEVKVMDISLFPNPTTGNFIIQWNTTIPSNTSILLLDFTGKIIMNQMLRWELIR